MHASLKRIYNVHVYLPSVFLSKVLTMSFLLYPQSKYCHGLQSMLFVHVTVHHVHKQTHFLRAIDPVLQLASDGLSMTMGPIIDLRGKTGHIGRLSSIGH